ncbi:hypothetical protein [Pseudoduganella violacea]|uniref:Uncharacterized protein n=1 Tax=Pseudoduganella violacea TaxID=1715466 RepID=A0A7W5FWL1_9BURK|nr:hypothetical protein [Pseudoduganella violacea]MBB3121942.1 hypothetical protein [Pseudoduganella violacea]
MNRLPLALSTRQLEELLPKAPVRPGQNPAARHPAGAGAAPAAPPPPLSRPPRGHARPAAPPAAEAGGRAPAPPREPPAAANQDGAAGEPASMERQQGGGNESEQDDAGLQAAAATPSDSAADEAEAIAALLSNGAGSGIFEVILPNGETLGVAVDSTPAAVTYHLKPACSRTAERLRAQQRELTGHLERRIGKGVSLTIL